MSATRPAAGRTPWRTGRALAILLALSAAVSGCTFKGVSSMPLPGGVDTGADPYEVKMVFENVLDLVPQSECRVNDVPVGMVTKIDLVDWKAVVTCRLRGSVDLPGNAVAAISQTSLLGEKFVALSAPQGQTPQGKLVQGAEIPLDRTSRSTEVEEVLSAMSMLVTGGGLEQISTINHELNAALQGHTVQLRDVLGRLNTFVGTLDRQKGQIVTTIDKVDKLSSTLAKHNKTIADTIDSTGPAVKVLASQRKDLTKLLVNVDKLGTVATRIINRSQSDTVANLQSLQTILINTNKASNAIPKVLGGPVHLPVPADGVPGDQGRLRQPLHLPRPQRRRHRAQLPGRHAARRRLQGRRQAPGPAASAAYRQSRTRPSACSRHSGRRTAAREGPEAPAARAETVVRAASAGSCRRSA